MDSPSGGPSAGAGARALARALDLARRGPQTENPQVGCVLLDDGGEVLGEGWHAGAGTPHAEVAALADAAARGRGTTGCTAVVTLEPCRHTGRTGPCTRALLAAGVARVVVGAPDPTPVAGGGAAELTAAGVPARLADDPALRAEAAELLRPWARAHRHRRPLVTWKYAATLDGFSAAPDGSSRWVTGPVARADVHARRARHDAVLVGTGTALADDPALTVRDADGAPLPHQPLRVVVGLRDLPAGAQLLDGSAETVHLRTRDPREALGALWDRGVRSVWLEGGPQLAAAFWRAGLVDDVVAHLAPALLGGGRSALGDLGATSIGDALRLELVDACALGGDVVVLARPTDQTQTQTQTQTQQEA
ncbi:bifunctional diaminohydroxyphosphoribosylaminopyrimidine deaminase/5-amino-6-(5-phosphoribosylamino)uracil reductase RibD [Quadrisphaera sp. INWT6]|uniref:bifunctional diaminohydroxyphosphoribosylaminopyrimidine deaminase/5-amino-6-(5-phosphoribosylamino)uracil reductase RibD n=1 Tax=Quadrisphaera sp. INWT6 TaxID=2596917 RepID=UPI001891F75B|nr:bifunctional diaminohydroxyphosphoribosylaminopyrimidine deaminase/5-amino-6-(5-phosphoribosylamino)uracil reductase RibD [Quadrisphaera sp. INWT6]MBF5081602.1 bifunctional diaminohydroxyphosphoribosylaminopyrimidine deaminase/5-amino-6-(5-phosphoribosylamino)uracil reductase RibD [Quadrisphaera sp. INWT6]